MCVLLFINFGKIGCLRCDRFTRRAARYRDRAKTMCCFNGFGSNDGGLKRGSLSLNVLKCLMVCVWSGR